ncbi:MAG: hypothetical protein ACLP5E_22740 [Streptosporangiaceae bacterium]
MAIAGSWKAGAVTPSEYAGSLRWGTGIDPIHGVRDSGTRDTGIKENLLPLGAGDTGDFVPESILGPEQWGYSSEDAAAYAGEDYRYLAEEHPDWGEDGDGRPDRANVAAGDNLGQQLLWPSWGPHGADQDDPDAWPLPGWPGGENVRAFSEGSEIENSRAIAVPTPGWRGGWLNKAHGPVEEAETSDPSQYEITTSLAQLHKTRVNDAAVLRGTDDPRSPIATRLTGQKVRYFPMSSGMGGGPGSPDMAVLDQDLPYRPWFFRQAAMPPKPDTFYGTMTAFDPIERTLPADASEYVTVQESPAGDGSYGYAEGDYFGG